MKSLIADAAIYLIQVQGDKNHPVSGESLCVTPTDTDRSCSKETMASSTTRHN